MPWKDALVEQVHASWPWRMGRRWKERAKRMLAAQARRWGPTLAELRALMRAAGARLRARASQLLRNLRERWSTSRASL